MRQLALAVALLAVPAGLAVAASFDARGLARFDVGYARCEARFETMRGQRDQAYLAVYRVKPDAAALQRLAVLRRGADYQKERRRALAAAPAQPASGAASSPLDHQCQALRAEIGRARPALR